MKRLMGFESGTSRLQGGCTNHWAKYRCTEPSTCLYSISLMLWLMTCFLVFYVSVFSYVPCLWSVHVHDIVHCTIMYMYVMYSMSDPHVMGRFKVFHISDQYFIFSMSLIRMSCVSSLSLIRMSWPVFLYMYYTSPTSTCTSTVRHGPSHYGFRTCPTVSREIFY